MSKIDELQQKRSAIEEGGGSEMVKSQHSLGKKTARERLACLFDEGSFVELDAFVKSREAMSEDGADKPAESVVSGYGTVCGRLVYAYSQDYTVSKGAVTKTHIEKICKVMDMALKMGAPIVAILDSQGAKIESGLDVLSAIGKMLKKTAMLSGVVPQISMILGTCAGGSAFLPVIGDFVVMNEKNGLMFLNGPSISKDNNYTVEEIGGSDACSVKNGTASMCFASEDECFDAVKQILDYLPSNNLEASPYCDVTDDINRISEGLNAVSENTESADVKTVISELADNGAFFELSSLYAQNIVTGFIHLNGQAVGVVANQAKALDGMLDVKASKKAASFVRICDSFNIPLLTVTNTSGFVPSAEEEANGVLKSGAGLLFAFAEATVPKVNLIIGKAYGSAYLSMNSKHIGADMVFAWPGSEISVMSAESAANILFADELSASDDPINERKALIKRYAEENASPYAAASLGYVDDVFEPSATRQHLVAAFEMLMSKREVLPSKKHGNMPL